MKKVLILAFAAAALFLTACTPAATQEDGKIGAAVGIVPEAAFVQAVAGDRVDVVMMIPPGYSPANYSPTAAEMRALSDADIYFTLRMPAEEANILPKLGDFNPDIKIVDLHEAVEEVYPMRELEAHSHDDDAHEGEHSEEEHTDGEHHEDAHEEDEHAEDDHHDHGAVDPHVWLSPRRAVVMVQAIVESLSDIDPGNADEYRQNAVDYIEELEALDRDIARAMDALENKTFLIYHPSYGYFADDYGLEMLTIETAGKTATAAKMAEVVGAAKEHGIKTVFYQDEFSDSQAQAVAAEIGGTVHKAQPLSMDYIGSLRAFADALTAQGAE